MKIDELREIRQRINDAIAAAGSAASHKIASPLHVTVTRNIETGGTLMPSDNYELRSLALVGTTMDNRVVVTLMLGEGQSKGLDALAIAAASETQVRDTALKAIVQNPLRKED